MLTDKQFNTRLRNLLEILKDTRSYDEAITFLAFMDSKASRNYTGLLRIVTDYTADIENRLIGCWILGRVGDKDTVDILMKLAQDTNMFMRAEAIRSLGCLRSIDSKRRKSIVDFLMDKLVGESYFDARAACIYTIGIFKDERALPVLIRILNDDLEQPFVRGMAAETLGGFKKSLAVAHLIRALSSSSIEVRFWAIYALGIIGSVDALPHLESLLESSEELPDWGKLSNEAREAIQSIHHNQKITITSRVIKE